MSQTELQRFANAVLGVAGTVVAAILSTGVPAQRNGGANGVRRLDSGGL
ncbi:hypothetical protein [Azospirillum agricola]|nr:hypothetical protein [Azospirillum agricola]SMH28697.1 hypothetical protein SAMN02982994_0070 [Azospirillum lipoferum]